MIQRKQTVFLLVSLILTSVLFFIPIANILVNNSDIYIYNAFGIRLLSGNNELITNTYPILILIILTALLLLTSIFLYKKRLLQLRLCLLSIILSLGIYGLGFFYIYKLISVFETTVHYSFSIVIPLISIIFIYFAMRAIKKDELLIRSLDRIR